MYIVYKTTNLISGKIYVGVHCVKKMNDAYLGSGVQLKKAVKKYGRQNFARETLFEFANEQDAYDKEQEIVNIEFISRSDTYNTCIGGRNAGRKFEVGIIMCRDIHGNVHRVTKEDERYKSGELQHIGSKRGLVRIININTNKQLEVSLDVAKEMVQTGQYEYWSKGYCKYIDSAGKYYWIKNTDPIIKKFNLTAWFKNKVVVKDKDGNIKSINNNDWKKSGEFVSIVKDTVTVKDVFGHYHRVSIADPRYTSGELVGVNSGRKGLTTHLNSIKKTCEHCSKQASLANYKRWHGTNCKHKL
jgi:hypothetical protein